MKIVKQLNGNVHITDDSGNIERVMNNQPTILWVNDNNDLHIVQQNDRYENIDVADITATQILPAAEIPFAGTAQDLLTLLSADFFFDVSAGCIANAENGLYVAGDKVRLGGVLIENTIITEDGFDFSSDREEEPNMGYGSVTSYYKSEIAQPLPNIYPVNSLTRKIGIIDNLGDAEIGVFADNYYEAVGYFKANLNTSESVLYVSGTGVSMKTFVSGVENTSSVLSANTIITQAGTALFSIIKNGAISLISNNSFLNTDFAEHNHILRTIGGAAISILKIPIEEIISAGSTYTYSKIINNNTFLKIEFNGTYIEGGKSGFGTIETKGGAGKVNISPAIAVTSTEDIRSTAGMSSVSTLINVSGSNAQWQITNNSIEDNIKVSGVLTIIQRNTTVS